MNKEAWEVLKDARIRAREAYEEAVLQAEKAYVEARRLEEGG